MRWNHVRREWVWVACAVLCLGTAAFASAVVQPLAMHAGAQRATEGYLGIGFHDVSDEEAAALHLKPAHGAEIVMVDHDGPAGKAGLRPRDVITSLNGQLIDSAATLKRLLHEAGANVTVAMNVLRGGQSMTVQAKLASRDEVERTAQEHLLASPPPPPPSDTPDGVVVQSFTVETYAAAPAPADSAAAGKPGKSSTFLSSMLHSGPFTGMDAEELGPQMRAYFGVNDAAGLLVNKVAPGSPAAVAGLHAGDVVVRADGAQMRTVADWSKHLKAVKGHAIALVVVRDKHEQILMLTPDLKHRSALVCEPPVCVESVTWG